MLERTGRASDTAGVRATIAAPPVYETEEAPFGMRQASLRHADDDRTYVRVAHFFFPFVVVVPNGYGSATHVFCFAPIDDTHHLVVFGNYGETPLSLRDVSGALTGELPDPRNFASLQGDHSNRWGQDRELMNNGHWSGFGRSAIEEDTVVQASMGPIVDRTKENLSSSDVAVAHTRRLILDTIAAYEAGRAPARQRPVSGGRPDPAAVRRGARGQRVLERAATAELTRTRHERNAAFECFLQGSPHVTLERRTEEQGAAATASSPTPQQVVRTRW